MACQWTTRHHKCRLTANWRLSKYADGTLTMDTFLCLYSLGWHKRSHQNSCVLRASALTRRGAPAMAISVGAYYHAGSVGIRSNTKKYPCTAALLAHMVRACTHSNFTAVSLLRNLNMATHVDRYNQPGSINVLVPLSSFRRGELWLQEDHGPDLSPKGQHQGRNHPLRMPGLEFNPSPSTRRAHGRTTG